VLGQQRLEYIEVSNTVFGKRGISTDDFLSKESISRVEKDAKY